jgi:hypothetical protein
MKTKRTGVEGRGQMGLALRLAMVAAVGGSLGAAPALAQERVDETRSLRSDGVLDVRLVSHGVQLIPWDRDEVRVRGEYDPDWEELEIRGSGQSVIVEIRHEGRGSGRRSVGRRTMEIQFPAGARVDVGTVSGSIEGAGLRGTVGANSVSGDVRLRGADVQVATVNSVSGSVEVEGRASEVRARTVSGSLRVTMDAPLISAHSVSGGVRVEGAAAHRRVELGAVSGRVVFRGSLAPGGELNVESHSGGVELDLNRDVDARFHLSTFSGSIRADLEGARDRREERGRFAPGETLTFTTGQGAGRVEARSFSGSVRVTTGGG